MNVSTNIHDIDVVRAISRASVAENIPYCTVKVTFLAENSEQVEIIAFMEGHKASYARDLADAISAVNAKHAEQKVAA
jgi:hypothetical protein